MEDVFRDVKPTRGGIPSARHLTERMSKYFKRRGLDYIPTELHVTALPEAFIPKPAKKGARPLPVQFLRRPEDAGARPPFECIVRFIEKTLSDDVPVCFLCLDSGEDPNLDDWHWITLYAMRERDGKVICQVSDNGKSFELCLRRWYDTSVAGGGFVGITERKN
jgi:hypothetical protein